MRLPSMITWSITGMPSSQVLPGFLITAPPSVCVPDDIGALACGCQTPKKERKKEKKERKCVNERAVSLTSPLEDTVTINSHGATLPHGDAKKRSKRKRRGSVQPAKGHAASGGALAQVKSN